MFFTTLTVTNVPVNAGSNVVSYGNSDVLLQDGNEKRWSYEKLKKKRNRRRKNFFYAGLGFSVSGMAFNMKGSNAVLSNGFMTENPLLGDIVRVGYEYSGLVGYFAAEIYGSFLFSISQNGLIGSLVTGESIELTSFGRGTLSTGVNMKPGFSFNNSKGATYLIVGAGYQWLQGNYTNQNGAEQAFHMSGFGLNYGIGMKYTLRSFVMLFLDFIATAPIKGNGVFDIDRTAYTMINGVKTRLDDIAAFEYYSVNIGLDFRV